MMTETTIPAGTLFIVTHGEYSDYGIIMVCTALQDFDIWEVKQEFLTATNGEAGNYGFEDYGFANWLIIAGYAEEMTYREFGLGGYHNGEFWVSRMQPVAPFWAGEGQ